MKKFKEGHLYFIRFLDHSFGYQTSALSEVCGWVEKDREHDLLLTVWNVCDKKMKSEMHEAIEPVVIIKSTILKKRLIHVPD